MSILELCSVRGYFTQIIVIFYNQFIYQNRVEKSNFFDVQDSVVQILKIVNPWNWDHLKDVLMSEKIGKEAKYEFEKIQD